VGLTFGSGGRQQRRARIGIAYRRDASNDREGRERKSRRRIWEGKGSEKNTFTEPVNNWEQEAKKKRDEYWKSRGQGRAEAPRGGNRFTFTPGRGRERKVAGSSAHSKKPSGDDKMSYPTLFRAEHLNLAVLSKWRIGCRKKKESEKWGDACQTNSRSSGGVLHGLQIRERWTGGREGDGFGRVAERGGGRGERSPKKRNCENARLKCFRYSGKAVVTRGRKVTEAKVKQNRSEK